MHRFLSIVWWLSVCSVCSVGTLRSQPANVQADPTTGVLFRPSAATFISGNNLATAAGGIVLGANGGTGVANTGKTITLGGNVTTVGAYNLGVSLSGNTTVSLPTTGTLATLTGSETLTNKTLTSPTLTTPILGAATATSLTLSGNISSAAWTTSGVRIKGVTATLTDTTSTGTVAAAYTDVLGGNTIAASNATTFTDYITAYFREPTAGSLVTMTNKWALGSESLRVGTSTPMTVSTAGGITANSLTGRTATNLTLAGGSTGASLVLGQGATGSILTTFAGPSYIRAGQMTATYAGLLFGNGTLADSATGFNIAANATNSNLVFNINTGGSMNWRVGNANAFTLSSGSNLLIGGTTDSGARVSALKVGVSPASSGTTSTAAFRAFDTNNVALDIGVKSDASPFPGWIQVHDTANQATNYPLSLQGNGSYVTIGTLASSTVGTGGLYVAGTTAASSTTSGALQVAGGVGVAGAGYFGGDLFINKTTPVLRLQESGSTQMALIYFSGNSFFDYTGTLTFRTPGAGPSAVATLSNAGVLNLQNTTSATSSTVGALTIGNGTAATNVAIGGGSMIAGANVQAVGNINVGAVGADFSAGRINIQAGSDTVPGLSFGGTNYGFGILEKTDGNLYFSRRSGSATNTTWMSVDRGTGAATFAGTVTLSSALPELRLSNVTTTSPFGLTFYNGSDYDASLRHQTNTGVLTLDVGRNSSWGGDFDIYIDTVRSARFSKNITTFDQAATFAGAVSLSTAGTTVSIKSGTNAAAGTVTLVAGNGTITSTAIDVNTVIVMSIKTKSGSFDHAPSVVVAAGSATIDGHNSDDSTYNWIALKVN